MPRIITKNRRENHEGRQRLGGEFDRVYALFTCFSVLGLMMAVGMAATGVCEKKLCFRQAWATGIFGGGGGDPSKLS
jgi:hypothetical protein